MADSTAGKWGCGCLTIILIWYVGIPLVLGLFKMTDDGFRRIVAKYEVRAEKRREAAKEKEAAQKLEDEQKRLATERKAAVEAREKAVAERENRLRAFTLREAPSLWESHQALGAQIVSQNKKIDELRKTLLEFDKNPELDSDYKAICTMRDDMVGVKRSLKKKIEDAYIAYCKFQATPSRKEYDELRRKTLEDGIQEAEAATRRFTAMRREK